MRWKAVKYFFSPHSPQSPHFLRKFTAFTAFLTKIYPKTSTRASNGIQFNAQKCKMFLFGYKLTVDLLLDDENFNHSQFISDLGFAMKPTSTWRKRWYQTAQKQKDSQVNALFGTFSWSKKLKGGLVVCFCTWCSDPTHPRFGLIVYQLRTRFKTIRKST